MSVIPPTLNKGLLFVAAVAVSSATAYADGSPPQSGANTYGSVLEIEPGQIEVRDEELSVGAAYFTDSAGAQGIDVRAAARKIFYLGGRATRNGGEAPMIDPGVEVRLRGQAGDESAGLEGGLTRQEIRVSGFAAIRGHHVTRDSRVDLTAEEIEELDRSLDPQREAFTSALQRQEELEGQIRENTEELIRLNRARRESDDPEERARLRAASLELQETNDELNAELRRTVSTVIPEAELALHMATENLKADYPNFETAIVPDSAFEVRGVHAAYERRHLDDLDVQMDAAMIEVLAVSGHIAGRIEGVNVDFCGSASVGGSIGRHEVGEYNPEAAGHVRAMLCAGVDLGEIAHARVQGEYRGQYSWWNVNNDTQHSVSVNNVRGIAAMDRIGGTPLGVEASMEYDRAHAGPFERGVTTYTIGVGATH